MRPRTAFRNSVFGASKLASAKTPLLKPYYRLHGTIFSGINVCPPKWVFLASFLAFPGKKSIFWPSPKKEIAKHFLRESILGITGGGCARRGGGGRSFLNLFCSVKYVWCNQTRPSGAKRTIFFGNCRRMVLADFFFSFFSYVLGGFGSIKK